MRTVRETVNNIRNIAWHLAPIMMTGYDIDEIVQIAWVMICESGQDPLTVSDSCHYAYVRRAVWKYMSREQRQTGRYCWYLDQRRNRPVALDMHYMLRDIALDNAESDCRQTVLRGAKYRVKRWSSVDAQAAVTKLLDGATTTECGVSSGTLCSALRSVVTDCRARDTTDCTWMTPTIYYSYGVIDYGPARTSQI